MILRKVLYLRKSIASDRLNMYKIAKGKDLSHPDLIKIRQLDEKIVKLQKIMSPINI